MSKSKVGMNFKWCQNCVYWDGARKIDGFSKMTENVNDEGTCNCREGFFRCKTNHMTTCKAFTPLFQ